MKIIYPNKINVEVQLLSKSELKEIVQNRNGKVSERFHKHLTARTYEIDSNQLIMEFYDGQGILINDAEDFQALESVRFIKNKIGDLHPRVSYYFKLTELQVRNLINDYVIKELKIYERILEHEYDYSFNVFQLSTNQVIIKGEESAEAYLYEDLEALAFDNEEIYSVRYDYNKAKEEFFKGIVSTEHNINDYSVYDYEVDSIIKNHELRLVQTNIQYELHFFSNLYKSKRGYYILMEDFNQKALNGRKLSFGFIHFFKTIKEFELEYEKKQEYYKKFRYNIREFPNGVHVYESLSDKYGEKFPIYALEEMNKLPLILNFDSRKLGFTSECKTIINESLKWNYGGEVFFQSIIHPLLSYIGEYNKFNDSGDWAMTYREDKTWEPRFRNSDGEEVFDILRLYEDLYEAEYGIMEVDYYIRRK
jgi:hypothetical protein